MRVLGISVMRRMRGFHPRKFNSSPLKNDGWKTILSFWVSAYFEGRTVKFMGCIVFFFKALLEPQKPEISGPWKVDAVPVYRSVVMKLPFKGCVIV